MSASDVTPFFLWLVFVYALGPLQFGYHIGELNTPQESIMCRSSSQGETGFFGLLRCIPMTEIDYGTIVSMFPLGGLLGSLFAGRLSDAMGRRSISRCNTAFFILGPLLMLTANTVWLLAFGRLISGIGSGISMVSVPIYLNEISPPAIRGAVGTMTQLSCVVGILLAQLAGVYLSKDSWWRMILAIGGMLGLLQFVALWFTVESPKWLVTKADGFSRARDTLIQIRGRSDIHSEMKSWQIDMDEDMHDGEDRGLLQTPTSGHPVTSTSLRTFLTGHEYRPALVAVAVTQLAQQFTGTNAVIFYSTSILADLLPDLSAWISVGISIVNLIVTFVAANLIDRTGRRILLLVSLIGMCIASLTLAFGINHNLKTLSAVAATMIIASFALGLGPIPFLLISEYFDVEVVGLAQSTGLSINWIATFCIGFFFPIMRQQLGGSSFFVFSAIAALSFVGVWKFVPESKNKKPKEIWQR